jgi:hypothetical protein
MDANALAARICRHLPHSAHVSEHNALRWAETVLRVEPERAEWHFGRLFGLNSSTIGIAVAEDMGVPDLFGNTRRDILLEKLLHTTVEEPTPAMRSGQDLEPIARRYFLQQYGATAIPFNYRTPGTPEYSAARALHPNLPPWMVGSPDEIVVLSDGRLAMIDYKSPVDTGDYSLTGIPLRYACQLEANSFLTECNALDVDLAALAACGIKEIKFDTQFLVVFDRIRWVNEVYELPRNPELLRRIIAAGNTTWDMVLRGYLPARNPRDLVTMDNLPNDERETMEVLAGDMARFKAIGDAAASKADSLKSVINTRARIKAGQDLPQIETARKAFLAAEKACADLEAAVTEHADTDVQTAATEFATLRKMAEAASRNADRMKEGLREKARLYVFGNSILPLAGGVVNVTASPILDVARAIEDLGEETAAKMKTAAPKETLEAALAALARHKIPLTEARPSEYDVDMLMVALDKKGFKISDYITSESLSIAFTRSKTSPGAVLLGQLRASASEVVSNGAAAIKNAWIGEAAAPQATETDDDEVTSSPATM